VNAVTFVLPLLKGEVDSAELMLVEGLRVFYPRLYAGIRDNPDLFLNGQQHAYNAFAGNQQQPDQIEVLLQQSMPGVTEKERLGVRKGLLEALFPRLRMNYGTEWERIWANKQKLCSGQYFQRYFSYGVPDGDVPDSTIRTLIGDLADADTGRKRQILETFGQRRAIPRLISKLRDAADAMSEDDARTLLTAIVRNAHVFPRERAMSIGDTWMQGGILASQLLRRLPAGNLRQEAAEEAARVAEPLNFCYEYMRWISHSADRPEERRVLADEGEVAVNAILADRIRDAEGHSPLYIKYGRDAPSLYWLWAKQKGNQAVGEVLLNRFRTSPGDVDAFLDCYVGEGWLIESGLPVRSDFRREQYDSISAYVPSDFIVVNLMDRFGEELRTPSFHNDNSMPIARRIAHQFVFIHNAVQQEQSAPANAPVSAEALNNGAADDTQLDAR
jgi:hypothetical protein